MSCQDLDNLEISSQSLEKRLTILDVPSRRIEMSEWDVLSYQIRQAVPHWIPPFLAKYALAGAVLECRGKTESFVRLFSFFEPKDYALLFAEGSLYLPLTAYGLLPFADESDGNLWVGSVDVSGPINLLELSDWDRSQPSERNGLCFASRNLACLLASMGISEASYYENAQVRPRTMWYR
jgi:hypothetical protein